MAASSAATSGVTTIRVRLHFDYPPPAVADCRMCWVLVDLHRCRVVADLESVIRDRFHFGRKSLLSLFVEDCYLPHTESILVVRDNDTVRVKVDTLAQVNGCSSHPGTPKDKSSKRARCTEDDGSPTENGESVKKKDKKKKKKEKVGEEAMEAESKVPGDNDAQTKKKHKKNKKKTKMAEPEKTVTNATPKPATSKPRPAAASQPAKSTASASVNTKVSSSDSSDSSEEDEAPKKTPSQKAAPKTTSSTPTLPKPPPKAAPSVSSSETDSSSCDEAPKKAVLKNAKPVPSSTALNGATGDKNTSCKPLPGSSSSQPAHSSPTQRAGNVSKKAESADSSDSSEEEIKLVIKRPNAGLGFGLGPDAVGGPSPSARGRGRGNVRGVCGAVERGRGGGRDGIRTRGGGRGAGRVRGHVNFGFNYNDQQQQQPSYQTDSLTNESVVLQNPEESAPKRDYSTMPLLAAPPPVGESIAFKLLELTENYTPEVSEYKEGRIVSFDPITKQIQLDLLSASRGPVEPGKFDLVYTNADGTVDWSQLESAVTHSSQVAERWESLLEPRLIII